MNNSKTSTKSFFAHGKYTIIKKKLYRSRYLYILISLPLVFFILFKYVPMYGVIIAFQDFRIHRGYFGSPFVGFKHFSYLRDPVFWVLVKNTFLISFWQIVFCFPAPILFALLINEVKSKYLKGIVKNVSYLPHFISIVVITGIITTFLRRDGLINDFIAAAGGERHAFLLDPKWFRTIYIVSDVWANMGWSAIIYLAALTSVDPELYEAAMIDGAGRLRQIIFITIPCILPTIAIMFILRMGGILSVSFEKTLLLQNRVIYEVSDVISTFVYRRGISGAQYSYATAVDLFSSVINLVMLSVTNKLSRRASENLSLW